MPYTSQVVVSKVDTCDFIGPSLPTTTIHNVPAPRHFTRCNTYTPPFIHSYNSSHISFLSPLLLLSPPTTMPSSFVLSAARTPHGPAHLVGSPLLYYLKFSPIKPYPLVSQSDNLAYISDIRIELLCITEVRSRDVISMVFCAPEVSHRLSRCLDARYWICMVGGTKEEDVRYEVCSRK